MNGHLFLTNKYRKNACTIANDRLKREKPGDTTENANRSQGVRSGGNRPSGLLEEEMPAGAEFTATEEAVKDWVIHDRQKERFVRRHEHGLQKFKYTKQYM